MPIQYSRHPWQAFSLAVLVEVILLVGAGVLLAGVAVKKPVPEPVTITLLNAEKQPVKPLEKPPAERPKPKVMQPKAHSQMPTPPVTPPLPAQPVPATQMPTAFTRPVPPEPAPTPVADTSKAKASELYAAKVHAAVQAAHHYPPAAAALGYTGRVRVEFNLRDGIPGNPRILVPSKIGMIDRAALSAVQNAHYPAPPAELRGQDMLYQVWVEFNRE